MSGKARHNSITTFAFVHNDDNDSHLFHLADPIMLQRGWVYLSEAEKKQVDSCMTERSGYVARLILIHCGTLRPSHLYPLRPTLISQKLKH